MNIADYLIAHDNVDWAPLLRDWAPPLPERFSVWLVNRLGELFVAAENGAILKLDVGAGTCSTVAASREQFAGLLDRRDTADNWLRIRIVDECRKAGKNLKPFECYGFRIPPTLGGGYDVRNLVPTNLAVHLSYQAYICKQADIYWIPPG